MFETFIIKLILFGVKSDIYSFYFEYFNLFGSKRKRKRKRMIYENVVSSEKLQLYDPFSKPANTMFYALSL